MKYPALFLIALSAFITDPLKIQKINRIKSEARDAYNRGDYTAAIEKYKFLIDSLEVNEEEVSLNLANAYYNLKDTANAITTYQALSGSGKGDISSKAYQQLGVIANQQGKPEQALIDFKNAIKANPENDQARYNYEMVKKKLDEKNKEDQQKKDEDKDQKKNDKKDEPSEYAKKLKAQADQLVAQRRYKDAHELMTEGLSKDPTVSHYNDYIQRIKDVAEINGI
jgi:tetratricopeptide (TPR) repeat protein